MSKYTTQVRYLCETHTAEPLENFDNLTGVRRIDAIINSAHSAIFDFDYPIFSETKRADLESKILRHYYTREISDETFGLWQLRLSQKMNEIMPYYNQLYKSELLKVEPLANIIATDLRNEQRSGSNYDIHTGEDIDINLHNSQDDATKNDTLDSDSMTNRFDDLHTVKNSQDSDYSSSSGTRTGAGTGSNQNTDALDGEDYTEQTKAGENEHKQTNFDIISDTPGGALNNIIGSSAPSPSNIGLPQGSVDYASRVEEHTQITTDKNDDGKKVTHYGKTNHTNSDSSFNTFDTDTNEVNTSKQNDTKQNDNDASQELKTDSKHGNSVTNRNTDDISQSQRIKGTTMEHKLGAIYDTVNTAFGVRGVSQSKLLNEFRETFINIDKKIIDELRPLFFGLWA